MSTQTSNAKPAVRMDVNPGICGFPCTINARESGNRTVAVQLNGCECTKIQQLASNLTEITLKEVFTPITRNPVYMAAEKSACHPSCPIPSAILKAAEVVLGLALPQDVRIRFLND